MNEYQVPKLGWSRLSVEVAQQSQHSTINNKDESGLIASKEGLCSRVFRMKHLYCNLVITFIKLGILELSLAYCCVLLVAQRHHGLKLFRKTSLF